MLNVIPYIFSPSYNILVCSVLFLNIVKAILIQFVLLLHCRKRGYCCLLLKFIIKYWKSCLTVGLTGAVLFFTLTDELDWRASTLKTFTL
jgi:hypothetical protein